MGHIIRTAFRISRSRAAFLSLLSINPPRFALVVALQGREQLAKNKTERKKWGGEGRTDRPTRCSPMSDPWWYFCSGCKDLMVSCGVLSAWCWGPGVVALFLCCLLRVLEGCRDVGSSST